MYNFVFIIYFKELNNILLGLDWDFKMVIIDLLELEDRVVKSKMDFRLINVYNIKKNYYVYLVVFVFYRIISEIIYNDKLREKIFIFCLG